MLLKLETIGKKWFFSPESHGLKNLVEWKKILFVTNQWYRSVNDKEGYK